MDLDNFRETYKDGIQVLLPAHRKIRSIMMELKLLIEKKKAEGDPNFLNNARKEINLKYGRGWRERGLVSNDSDQW